MFKLRAAQPLPSKSKGSTGDAPTIPIEAASANRDSDRVLHMDSWRFLKRKTQKSTESIYLLCYSLLMFSERLPQVMDDLRFALQVLQEDSCLGLDPEYALKLQSVILRQIERDQHALNRRKPVETSTETVAA